MRRTIVMGKYLKKFDTNQEFQEEYTGESYIPPLVSYVADVDEVKYHWGWNDSQKDKNLTFDILTDGTVTFVDKDQYHGYIIQYRLNNGAWTSITSNVEGSEPTINVVAGDRLQFKGNISIGNINSNYCQTCFNGTAEFNISGNIASLHNFTVIYQLVYLFYDSNVINADNLYIQVNDSGNVCCALNGLFKNCVKLTSAQFFIGRPEQIVPSTSYMFEDCINLEKVPIFLANNKVGESKTYCMYRRCTKLKYVPDFNFKPSTSGNFDLGDMFSGCINLRKAPKLIDEEVGKINSPFLKNAFRDCTNLIDASSVIIWAPKNKNCDQMCKEMFYNCRSLKFLPDIKGDEEEHKYVFQNMFYNCLSLKEADLSNAHIKRMYDNMFQNCTALKSVTLSNTITNLQGSVFDGCTSLEEITLNGPISTGNNCFRNTPNIKKVNIDSVESILKCNYDDCSGGPFFDGKTAHFYINGQEYFFPNTFTIPQSITKIGSGSLCNVKSLGSVIIPSNITDIGSYAFYGSSVTDITFQAEHFTFRDSFGNCPNLTTVTIYGSAYTWDSYPVNKTNNLTRINVGNINKYLESEFGHVPGFGSLGASSHELHLYNLSDGTKITNIQIPNTITTLGQNVLSYCVDIESVTFAQNSQCTKIGNTAFNACTSLRSITIPDTVTTLSDACFRGCTSLTSVNVPSGVTTIEGECFRNCSNLEELTLPASVTSIKNYAFTGCNKLKLTILASSWTNQSYDNTYSSSLLELNLPNVTNVNGVQLIGTCNNEDSALRVGGNVTKPSGSNSYHLGNARRIYINGDLIQNNAGQILIRQNNRELHIKGNINCTDASGAYLVNAASSKLKFVEVGGTITNTREMIFVNTSNGCADGFIWHFGKTDGIACSPTVASVSFSRVAKVYVGDGSSQANDQAVLNMYLADADWAQYSSKLDLWYNYSGEFKQNWQNWINELNN